MSRIEGLSTLHRPDILSVDTLAAGAAEMRQWRWLCPFHVLKQPDIPVPGRPGLGSRSVEAVWQGLKLVDGRLDLVQLNSDPYKRPPDGERGEGYRYEKSTFMLGGQTVDLIAARYLIYLPTYLYLLAYLVPTGILTEVEAWLSSGRDVAFYDWDANMDIDNEGSSFSHSALLARWFEGDLDPLVQRACDLARAHGVTPSQLPTSRTMPGTRW